MGISKLKVDMDELGKMSSLLNDAGIVKNKIKIDKKMKKVDAIESFMKAVESIPEKVENDIPAEVTIFYNALVDQLEAQVAETKKDKPEKVDKPKETKKDKPEKVDKPKEKKEKVVKEKVGEDEFGYRLNTKSHFFVEELKKGPIAMKDIKECPWNDNKATYFGTFSALKKVGAVSKDEDGKMVFNSKWDEKEK
jgi:hypothetical protein